MQLLPFLIMLLITASLLVIGGAQAADPVTKTKAKPRLIPRPLPGMVAAPAAAPSPAAVVPVVGTAVPRARGNEAAAPSAGAVSEPARILFIHRRATLPAALQIRPSASSSSSAAPVPARNAAAAADGGQGSLREGQVRIIPKAEASALIVKNNP